MDLQEFLEIGSLLELYKNLLSEKQKEYLIQHFEKDYSLSEIANTHNVSRQAVSDNIKRGIKLLNEYEKKLKMFDQKRKLRERLESLEKDFRLEVLENIMDELL
ncbi:YlxM family DNA-binding protein [uncultured Fusobacterium sp.]|uniref:YlxM family DNA-binding protein n=1 Tax=uncultured Fusobacterium sp. TaxID=159267 RepID=UPI0025914EC3|nr:sigma factor-like helix-turn-helix DNA-binding protein [uncultured Fusobacterium sp.]